jgi:hypothetical protein
MALQRELLARIALGPVEIAVFAEVAQHRALEIGSCRRGAITADPPAADRNFSAAAKGTTGPLRPCSIRTSDRTRRIAATLSKAPAKRGRMEVGAKLVKRSDAPNVAVPLT